jgi:cation diffusion facilitator family transporter
MAHLHLKSNETKTMWVVMLAAITMVVEIFFGITTRSMALLADGIHMGSHVLAIGLSWIAYVFVRRLNKKGNFAGNSDKVLSLSGFTSGIMLLIFAFLIMFEAFKRFFSPEEINYPEALIIAVIGLMVNLFSAFLLHHDEKHSDHNIKAAYLHVLADAFTSVSAIVGLTCAMIWGISFVDTIVAVLSSMIIIKWSVGLLKQSGSSLLDIEES